MAKMIDLTMLGMLTGRERTAEEHAELLTAAGFTLDRVLRHARAVLDHRGNGWGTILMCGATSRPRGVAHPSARPPARAPIRTRPGR